MKRSLTAWLVLIGLTWALSSVAEAQHYYDPHDPYCPPQGGGGHHGSGFSLAGLKNWGLSGVGEAFHRSEDSTFAQYPDYNYAPGPQFDTGMLFAPIDVSPYGSGPKHNEGFFGSYEYLYYSMTAPDDVRIGQTAGSTNPLSGGTIIYNDSIFSTGAMENIFRDGSRAEIGWMRKNRGWLFSGAAYGAYNHEVFGSGINFHPPLAVRVFNGPTPIPTYDLMARNETETYSAEAMRIWRLRRPNPPLAWDPTIEFMAGVRYMRMRDDFFVTSEIPGNIVRTITDANDFFRQQDEYNTFAENNMVGPQIGFRYEQERGPLSYDFSGRLMAAFNFRTFSTDSRIGTAYFNDPPEAQPPLPPETLRVQDEDHDVEVMPVVEFRVNAKYQVTRLIKVGGGWSMVYMGEGLGRSSDAINWDTLTLFNDIGTQDALFHGFNLMVEVNR